MALVCCVAIAVVIFRMRNKKIRPALGIALLGMCLLPIALAEVKAAFVWLIVIFAVLFAQQIGREPIRAVVMSTAQGCNAWCTWLASAQRLTDQSRRTKTLQEFGDKQIKYAFDPNEYRADRKRLGPVAALSAYWWERHDMLENPATLLLGHGVGASRSTSSLGSGEVARRLPFPVDITAASVLLWDVGLLGALSFAGLLMTAGVAAMRLSIRLLLDPAWRESTTVAACTLAVILSGLLYNKDAVDNPAVQVLLFFSVAQVVSSARRAIASIANILPHQPAHSSPWPQTARQTRQSAR